VQESVTVPVTPLIEAAVIVKFAELPAAMLAEADEAERVKLSSTTCTCTDWL
jgi:hypothetical protein